MIVICVERPSISFKSKSPNHEQDEGAHCLLRHPFHICQFRASIMYAIGVFPIFWEDMRVWSLGGHKHQNALEYRHIARRWCAVLGSLWQRAETGYEVIHDVIIYLRFTLCFVWLTKRRFYILTVSMLFRICSCRWHLWILWTVVCITLCTQMTLWIHRSGLVG